MNFKLNLRHAEELIRLIHLSHFSRKPLGLSLVFLMFAIPSPALASDCAPNALKSYGLRATVSEECFTKFIWTANAMDQIRRNDEYEYYVISQAISLLYAADPHLPAEKAIAEITAAQNAFSASDTYFRPAQATPYERVVHMYRSLVPATTLSGRQLITILVGWSRQGVTSLQDVTADEFVGLSSEYSPAVDSFGHSSLSRLYDDYRLNMQEAAVADHFITPIAGVNFTADAASIINSSPQLSNNQVLAGLYKQFASGSSVIDTSQLIALSAASIQPATAALNDGTKLLSKIQAVQDDIYNYDPNSPEAMQLRKEAQDFESRASSTAEQIQTSISVLADLASLFDAGLGTRIAAAGTGAAAVVSTVAEYANDAASIGDKVISVATSLATGDIVGAVNGILSFFSGGGPSPSEAAIKQQLSDIQSQLSSLHTEMTARFDHIDRELNALYAQMETGFNALLKATQYIESQVEQIRTLLLNMELEARKFETNVDVYFADEWYKTLLYDISYLDGNNPDQSGLNTIEGDLWLWTNSYCNESAAAGPTQRFYDDPHLFAEVTGYPFERNVNFISQYPAQQLGLPPLSNGRICNPRDYLNAVHNYMHYVALLATGSTIKPDRVAAMLNSGDVIRNQLRIISQPTQRVLSSPRDTTSPILTKLLATYAEKAKDFQSAATQVTNDVVATSVTGDAWIFGSPTRSNSIPITEVIALDPNAQDYSSQLSILLAAIDIWYTRPSALFDGVIPLGSIKFTEVPGYLFENVDPAVTMVSGLRLGKVYVRYSWRIYPPPCDPNDPLCHPSPVPIPSPFPPPPPTITVGLALELDSGAKALDISYREVTLASGQPLTTTQSAEAFISAHWHEIETGLGKAPELVSDSDRQKAFANAKAIADPKVAALQETLIGILTADRTTWQHRRRSRDIASALEKRDEMEGFKDLISTYVRLGLPSMVQSNDRVHAALFGNQGLLDRRVMTAAFLSAARPLHTNFLNDIFASSGARLDKLHGELSAYYADENIREVFPQFTVAADELVLLQAQLARNHHRALRKKPAQGSSPHSPRL